MGRPTCPEGSLTPEGFWQCQPPQQPPGWYPDPLLPVKRLQLVDGWSHSVWITFKHAGSHADGVATCPTANASVTVRVSVGTHSLSVRLPVRCHAIELPRRPVFQTAFSLHPGCPYASSQLGKRCGETEFAWVPARDPNCCLDAGGGLGNAYRNASGAELHRIWRNFSSFVTTKSISPTSDGSSELVEPEDYTPFAATANTISVSAMPCSGDGHLRNCSDADVEAVRRWARNRTTIDTVHTMQAAGLHGLSVYGFGEPHPRLQTMFLAGLDFTPTALCCRRD